jgi:hypothetical protein
MVVKKLFSEATSVVIAGAEKKYCSHHQLLRVYIRHEEPIWHALLEVPDHCRIGSSD